MAGSLNITQARGKVRYDRPNNGGKRRRHVPPSLDAEKLQVVSQMKHAGSTMRVMAAALGVASSTISRAINHQGAYQGSGI